MLNELSYVDCEVNAIEYTHGRYNSILKLTLNEYTETPIQKKHRKDVCFLIDAEGNIHKIFSDMYCSITTETRSSQVCATIKHRLFLDPEQYLKFDINPFGATIRVYYGENDLLHFLSSLSVLNPTAALDKFREYDYELYLQAIRYAVKYNYTLILDNISEDVQKIVEVTLNTNHRL